MSEVNVLENEIMDEVAVDQVVEENTEAIDEDMEEISSAANTKGGKLTVNKKAKDVPLTMVVSNKFNPDPNRLDQLAENGYVLFPCDRLEEKMEMRGDGDKAKEVVVQKATPEDHVLSTLAFGDLKQRKAYTKLVEQFEPDLVELASSITQSGQLQAVGLKAANRDKTEFHLVFGCRRFFAMAYLRAKLGISPGKISAEIQSCNDAQAKIAAFSENIHRKALNKMQEAETVKAMSSTGKSLKQIAKDMGLSLQTVQNKIDLADAPEKIKNKVRSGKLGITRATEMSRDIKNGGDGLVGNLSRREIAQTDGTPLRLTSLPWKQVAAIYDTCFEDQPDDKEFYTAVRRILFPILRYATFKEADKQARIRRKSAEAAAKAAAEAAEAVEEEVAAE